MERGRGWAPAHPGTRVMGGPVGVSRLGASRPPVCLTQLLLLLFIYLFILFICAYKVWAISTPFSPPPPSLPPYPLTATSFR
jgi:hypothetical protein